MKQIRSDARALVGHSLGTTLGALALLALVGCASGDLVVLLPDDAGHVGALQVQAGDRSLTLNTANAAARGGASAGTFSADDIAANFSDALAAEPPVPLSYQLYFKSGGSELDPGSRADLDAMLAEVRARAVVDVQLTGHTDRVGSVELNDRLALERARAVRQMLIDTGLVPEMVSAVGRGEREPLVTTPDEVPEARNRRVQAFVR